MDDRNLSIACNYATFYKGYTIDIENHIITIPFSKDHTENDIPYIMQEGSIGKWYVDNGFNVSFEVRDVEYITKPIFEARSMTSYKGHKAYLRNRLVATITW